MHYIDRRKTTETDKSANYKKHLHYREVIKEFYWKVSAKQKCIEVVHIVHNFLDFPVMVRFLISQFSITFSIFINARLLVCLNSISALKNKYPKLLKKLKL